jgi:heat shock protein HslJ
MADRSFTRLVAAAALACALAALSACGGSSARTADRGAAATFEAPRTTAAADESGEAVTLYVGPGWVDCSPPAAGRCLQARTTTDGDYAPFAAQISGFDFQEGYTYELRVRRTPDSTTGWRLLEQVRKEPVARPTENAGIEGTAWRLVSYADASGAMVRPPSSSPPALRLQGGQLSGSGGCNSYAGTYTLSGIGLALAIDAVTDASCGPEVMAAESAMLDRMPEVTSWLAVGPQLQLVDGRGRPVLVFRAEVAPDQSE